MSSNLYLLFQTAEAGAEVSLPQFLEGMDIPGYSFWDNRLKHRIKVPGEPDVPERCLFYAQNYFRIFISDLVIQFCREIESTLPPEIAAAEKHFQSTVFGLRQFRLRRWIMTEEGWDDDDNPYMRIVSEGNSPESFKDEQTPCSP